jgi:hypothetical protein
MDAAANDGDAGNLLIEFPLDNDDFEVELLLSLLLF